MLIESHDPEFVVNNLLLIVMGKLLTPKAAIFLTGEQSGALYVAGSKGRTGLKKGQQLCSPRTSLPFEKSLYRLHEFENVLPEPVHQSGLDIFFSIRTSSEHLGYLCIAPKTGKGNYPETELDFIENLVIISAVALSNSFLVSRLKAANRELDQKVQELNTLFDISREFNAMVDRSQMLNVFRFTLMGQMFVRRFFFLMKLEDRPQLIIQQGLKGTLGMEDKEKLLEMDTEYMEISDMDDPPDFLKDNQIFALIRMSFQDERAVLGISKRANQQPYTLSDYNFLISLGNLAFLSIQKTFLLESRIEKERMEEELTIARTIQNTLFPSPLPKPKPLDISATNVPSRQVGGDYYDVLCSDERNLYLAIADLTGKGIPASLLMANLQAMLHVLSPLQLDMSETTGKINDIIFKNTPSDKFISFFWGRIDLENLEFQYCNAGHNPPVYWNAKKQKIELLSTGGMLLGALSTFVAYEQGTIELGEGDVVLMFTDGISEAMNENEEEFGEERIADILASHHHETSQQIQQHIVDEVKTFCKGNYGDDMTMLIFKVGPS